jgi:hypothetical protein
MEKKYSVGLPVTREDIAWTLHEWHAALAAVHESADAQIYEYAATLVVAYLSDRRTFGALLNAFFAPDRDLRRLITELCTEGETQLEPQLLLGASCALRHLVEDAVV